MNQTEANYSKEELYKNILDILSNLREAYVIYKTKINENNSEKSFEVTFYEELVKTYGEDDMLNLNFSNISNFEEQIKKYGFSITVLSNMLEKHFGKLENQRFQDSCDELITMEELNFMQRNKKGLEFLEQCREEYNISMIKKEILDSILNTGIPQGINAEKFLKLQVYDKLLKIGGEEIVSNLDFSSIQDLKEKLSLNVNMLFKGIDSDLKKIEELSLKNNGFSKKSLDDLKSLKYLERKKIERANIRRQEAEKSNFKELIESSGFISKENIDIMMKNLEKSLTKGIEVVDKLEHAGSYYSAYKKIKIKNDIPSVVVHEILHAASTKLDNNGDVKNIGTMLFGGNKSMGTSINEGMTEYFTQRLFKGKTPYVSYEPLVNIVKDLVILYGEENIFETYLNDQERLETLMEQDGKSYMDFLDMADTYHKMIYKNEDLAISKSRQHEVAKSQYEKICCFIEDIREKRQRENPGINLPKCESRRDFEYRYNFKNQVGEFFKNIFSKIKDRFSVKEEQVLLGSGEVFTEQLQNGQPLNTVNGNSHFRETMNQENFKTSFEGTSTLEVNSKKEKQSDINIENER